MGITAGTTDPRPDSCADITCGAPKALDSGSGTLANDGASLAEVDESLVHMYNIGSTTESQALAYYE